MCNNIDNNKGGLIIIGYNNAKINHHKMRTRLCSIAARCTVRLDVTCVCTHTATLIVANSDRNVKHVDSSNGGFV